MAAAEHCYTTMNYRFTTRYVDHVPILSSTCCTLDRLYVSCTQYINFMHVAIDSHCTETKFELCILDGFEEP